MKIYLSIALVAILVLIGSVGFYLHTQSVEYDFSSTSQVLTQEDLVNLVKPGVVRIVHHITGEATFNSFDVNLKTFEVYPDGGQSVTIPVDDYLLGSGFIVNNKGLIVSNAHVVSDEAEKVMLAKAITSYFIDYKISTYSDAELAKLGITQQNASEKGYDLAMTVMKYVLKDATYKLKDTLTVLNPNSKKDNLSELLKDGIPAKLVSANGNFAFDDKDVGQIQIEVKGNVPFLKLGDSNSLTTGNKLYVFGFPASADFQSKNLNESTFTQGVVSAFKDSINKDFKLIQTDAKISSGSSGGPMFDQYGNVVAITTFASSLSAESAGDSFAFAIPIQLPKDFLEKSNLLPGLPGYQEHFLLGLNLLAAKHCKSAMKEFDSANENIDPNFSVTPYLASYVDECQTMINNGESVDTKLQSVMAGLKNNNKIAIVVLISVLVILFAGLIIYLLYRRLNRDEETIVQLQHQEQILEEHQRQQDSTPPPPPNNDKPKQP